jgi:hypothetical protein
LLQKQTAKADIQKKKKVEVDVPLSPEHCKGSGSEEVGEEDRKAAWQNSATVQQTEEKKKKQRVDSSCRNTATNTRGEGRRTRRHPQKTCELV